MLQLTSNSDLTLSNLPEDAREEGARLKARYYALLSEGGFLNDDGALDIGQLGDAKKLRAIQLATLREIVSTAEELTTLEGRSRLKVEEVYRGAAVAVEQSDGAVFILRGAEQVLPFEVLRDGVSVVAGRELLEWRISGGHVFTMTDEGDTYPIARDGVRLFVHDVMSGWKVSGGHLFTLSGGFGGACTVRCDGEVMIASTRIDNWQVSDGHLFTFTKDGGTVGASRDGVFICDFPDGNRWTVEDGSLFVRYSTREHASFTKDGVPWREAIPMTPTQDWEVIDGKLCVVTGAVGGIVSLVIDGRTVLNRVQADETFFSSGHMFTRTGDVGGDCTIRRDGALVSQGRIDGWAVAGGRVFTRIKQEDGSDLIACDGAPILLNSAFVEWSESDGVLLLRATNPGGANPRVLRITVTTPPQVESAAEKE